MVKYYPNACRYLQVTYKYLQVPVIPQYLWYLQVSDLQVHAKSRCIPVQIQVLPLVTQIPAGSDPSHLQVDLFPSPIHNSKLILIGIPIFPLLFCTEAMHNFSKCLFFGLVVMQL